MVSELRLKVSQDFMCFLYGEEGILPQLNTLGTSDHHTVKAAIG